MDAIDHLAVALGMATLAGINLYLVAFITGLAVKFNWVILASQHEVLSVFGNEWVIAVSGALFTIEFLADKVPWIDSTWDSFHTLIRPVGGALLAISALGDSRPEFNVIVGLVAGGATVVSHGFKAGTRLVVNTVPEPFSNAAVSVAEDAAVVGGIALMTFSPKVSLALSIIFLALAIYMMPKMYRRIRGFFWLLGKDLTGWFHPDENNLTSNLSPDEDMALAECLKVTDPDVLWATDVLTGRTKGLRSHGVKTCCRGKLVAINGESGPKLYFVGKIWRRVICVDLEIDSRKVIRQGRFLSENIEVYDPANGFHAVFRLPISQAALAAKVHRAIGELKALPTTDVKAIETAS